MSWGWLGSQLRSVASFIWDFVVGDDWRVALGVAVGLAITAVVAASGAAAWWILPALAGAMLTVSVWRGSNPR